MPKGAVACKPPSKSLMKVAKLSSCPEFETYTKSDSNISPPISIGNGLFLFNWQNTAKYKYLVLGNQSSKVVLKVRKGRQVRARRIIPLVSLPADNNPQPLVLRAFATGTVK